MFNVNSDNILFLTNVMSDFKNIYNDSIILDINVPITTGNELKNVDNAFNFFSIEQLQELSNLKNNVDELVKVFPSMEDDIEILDLWTRFGEECLQEVDSTPDVKLYYPEPFVASPSFVHEEL